MYVCVCARVAEREVRSAIHSGACTEEAVGAACGAGVNCGSCLDRIFELLDESGAQMPVAAPG
ncbi:MAG: (2Fe-2S)-binding protein [Micromonosporaceae bacterium]